MTGTPGPNRFTIDLVDPLFAVALHIGVLEGIMSQSWFKEWRCPTRGAETLYCFVFSLGFLNLAFSWIGYHLSIETKPVREVPRFFIDIVLVLLYAAVLVRSNDLGSVLFLLGIIYVLYVVWDLFKVKEYYSDYSRGGSFLKRYQRELTSLAFAVFFCILWVATVFWSLDSQGALILAIILTLAYRFSKKGANWSELLRFKSA